MSEGGRRTALTEGFIAGLLFGTSAIFIRLLGVLNASSLAFWRLIIACAVLGCIARVVGGSFYFGVVKKNIRQISVLGGFLGLPMVLYISAVKSTTILNACMHAQSKVSCFHSTTLASIVIENFYRKYFYLKILITRVEEGSVIRLKV